MSAWNELIGKYWSQDRELFDRALSEIQQEQSGRNARKLRVHGHGKAADLIDPEVTP